MAEAEYFEQDDLWGGSAASGPHAQRIAETVDLIPRDVATLLDLGAGDGALLHALAEARPELVTTAVERSRSAIGHVAQPRIVGSVDLVPACGGAVDCVTICEVIEHLPERVYRSTLAELGRVARRYVVITVPHAEDRRRARVTCPACGCRFNRFQHLRSFNATTMADLVPGFDLVRTCELGPRGVWYPWWLATAAERAGLVRRQGAPICPQCGVGDLEAAAGQPSIDGGSLKRLLPRARSRVWLGAVYRRSSALDR
jgi:hypothetical protein